MNFYILEKTDYKTDKGFTDTEWITSNPNYAPDDSDDGTNCPACHEYMGGRLWLPPYKIELVMYTNQFGNVVLGTGGKLIVDDYFKSHFEKTGMTGLEFIGEAEVVKLTCRWGAKKRQIGEPPKYYVARIKYGCAAIDHEKSGSVFGERKPTCDYCRLGLINAYSKIVIDENTWDGTDIFLARGIGSMITTSQQFKDWWDSCNFNNCKVIPAEEEHWDCRRPISIP